MQKSELLNHIKSLSVWKKGEQRAPHKPLLILFAIGELQKNNPRFIQYSDVREKLKELLIEFGPHRKSYHPEHPFVRLVNDNIWELSSDVTISKYSNKQLLDQNIAGGFTEDVYHILKDDVKLQQEIVETTLELHFPPSLHEDITDFIGLNFAILTNKKRDPRFRESILRAYEYSCAVCGFNVRLGNNLIGIEAAHIKWHQAGGPDTEDNGIALCSLHHKLFDRGVFTIDHERNFLVSEYANGNKGFDEWVMKYHGQKIRQPIQIYYLPNDNFLNWHVREVFKGPSRYTYQ